MEALKFQTNLLSSFKTHVHFWGNENLYQIIFRFERVIRAYMYIEHTRRNCEIPKMTPLFRIILF